MLVGTVFSVMPAFVYWVAGVLVIQGDPTAPTVGDIVAFTTLQSRLFFPVGQLLNVQVDLQGAMALFDRIFEYLDMEPEITDAPDALTLRPAAVEGRVRFRHVSFAYAEGTGGPLDMAEAELAVDSSSHGDGNGLDAAAMEALAAVDVGSDADSGVPFALEDIDFEVEPGQLVALVGPSGSGKTTSTYLVPRLYDVDSGAIEIDGHDVRHVKLTSLGDVIGFVTQEAYLFHASVRENLAYAKPGRDRPRAADSGTPGSHP